MVLRLATLLMCAAQAPATFCAKVTAECGGTAYHEADETFQRCAMHLTLASSNGTTDQVVAAPRAESECFEKHLASARNDATSPETAAQEAEFWAAWARDDPSAVEACADGYDAAPQETSPQEAAVPRAEGSTDAYFNLEQPISDFWSFADGV